MSQQSMSLSDQTKEIIFGSLLGDGSLRILRGYQNARFSFRHSEKSADYFRWKASRLSEIASEKHSFDQPADGFGKNRKLRFQSRALPQLTEIYELTHRQHQLEIRRKWLNHMTDLSLAVWWLDDGSLISNTRKGVFCTDGFDNLSVKRLARYLQVEWKIRTHVAAVGRKREGRQQEYWRLWIRSTAELKRFLRIILPHVPVLGMLSKAMILYHDPQLQQRWISEIAELTDFSRAEIEQVSQQRKRQLKAFQRKI